mmetsp:Transcript_7780/g.19441  ORF Transcript_7780/g.19441 Transcript_7780/m.19441 type:complete len:154 (+) Transcript_7780:72-533(+)
MLRGRCRGPSTRRWRRASPRTSPRASCCRRIRTSVRDTEAVVRGAAPLVAPAGSVWLYSGPVWTSNNVGAASFWKDYDAQTRYKHLSGQKEQSGTFRALTDTQRAAPANDQLCPTVLQATYCREYVAPRSAVLAQIAGLSEAEQGDLQRLGVA